jgi:hypothetical protein
MRLKSLVTVGIAGLSLGVAACGSSSSSSSSSSAASSSSTPSTSTAAQAPAAGKKGSTHHKLLATGVPGRIYDVKLTGKAETPAGAPKGAGSAVIALHGRSLTVCWRFSHLRGFTAATFAHIHQGVSGKAGNVVVPLSTTAKLHHKGCVASTATLIKAIEKDPHGYYVNIHSKKYPGGAVRAQL